MKLPLKRYKYPAEMTGTQSVQLPNGNYRNKTMVKFRFVYTVLHNSINNQLNNLGTTSNDSYLLATLDPRLRNYLEDIGNDKVRIHGTNYRIQSVTRDDSNLVPIYEVAIKKVNGFGGSYR